MPSDPLGYATARRILELGRGAFFAYPTDDLPLSTSEEVALDDLLPQFGFVGSRYQEHRILLLGINPGNGLRDARSPGDRTAMPALHRLAIEKTPEAFADAQNAYQTVCEGWAVWGRQCDELLRAGGLSKDEIAFTNALPWRTAKESRFGKFVAHRAASLYVEPIVDELQPRIIVAVGKRAAAILEYAGKMTLSVVVWNRARALRPQVVEERAAATSKFSTLLRVMLKP